MSTELRYATSKSRRVLEKKINVLFQVDRQSKQQLKEAYLFAKRIQSQIQEDLLHCPPDDISTAKSLQELLILIMGISLDYLKNLNAHGIVVLGTNQFFPKRITQSMIENVLGAKVPLAFVVGPLISSSGLFDSKSFFERLHLLLIELENDKNMEEATRSEYISRIVSCLKARIPPNFLTPKVPLHDFLSPNHCYLCHQNHELICNSCLTSAFDNFLRLSTKKIGNLLLTKKANALRDEASKHWNNTDHQPFCTIGHSQSQKNSIRLQNLKENLSLLRKRNQQKRDSIDSIREKINTIRQLTMENIHQQSIKEERILEFEDQEEMLKKRVFELKNQLQISRSNLLSHLQLIHNISPNYARSNMENSSLATQSPIMQTEDNSDAQLYFFTQPISDIKGLNQINSPNYPPIEELISALTESGFLKMSSNVDYQLDKSFILDEIEQIIKNQVDEDLLPEVFENLSTSLHQEFCRKQSINFDHFLQWCKGKMFNSGYYQKAIEYLLNWLKFSRSNLLEGSIDSKHESEDETEFRPVLNWIKRPQSWFFFSQIAAEEKMIGPIAQDNISSLIFLMRLLYCCSIWWNCKLPYPMKYYPIPKMINPLIDLISIDNRPHLNVEPNYLSSNPVSPSSSSSNLITSSPKTSLFSSALGSSSQLGSQISKSNSSSGFLASSQVNASNAIAQNKNTNSSVTTNHRWIIFPVGKLKAIEKMQIYEQIWEMLAENVFTLVRAVGTIKIPKEYEFKKSDWLSVLMLTFRVESQANNLAPSHHLKNRTPSSSDYERTSISTERTQSPSYSTFPGSPYQTPNQTSNSSHQPHHRRRISRTHTPILIESQNPADSWSKMAISPSKQPKNDQNNRKNDLTQSSNDGDTSIRDKDNSLLYSNPDNSHSMPMTSSNTGDVLGASSSGDKSALSSAQIIEGNRSHSATPPFDHQEDDEKDWIVLLQ